MTTRRESGARAEQKARTRATLISAALTLSRERGFSGVSLRDVARSAKIVPTAFYRHFASVEDLGIAIAEDGMRSARGALREIRRQNPTSAAEVLRLLANEVQANPEALRFVVAERLSAPTEVRRVITFEWRMLAQELALELARRDNMRNWDQVDLLAAASLILAAAEQAVTSLTEPDADPGTALEASTRALRLVFVGINHWHVP